MVAVDPSSIICEAPAFAELDDLDKHVQANVDRIAATNIQARRKNYENKRDAVQSNISALDKPHLNLRAPAVGTSRRSVQEQLSGSVPVGTSKVTTGKGKRKAPPC